MTFDELPARWQREIKQTRVENARFRIQRREMRQEIEALRAELKGK